MSTPLRTGVGSAQVIYNLASASQNVLHVPSLFEFSFTSDANRIEGSKFNTEGVLVTGASTKGETTNTLTLSSQVVNWAELGFYQNQLPDTDASVSIPLLVPATVPSSSPYEITDANITASNEGAVYVYVEDGNDSGYRTQAATAATPSAGEVGVDGANNTLIFHSSDAGKTISYSVPVSSSNREFYGGQRSASADTYGTVEFWGVVKPLNSIIYFPSLDFSTNPSIEFTGDVATVSVEFSANTPANWSAPYKEFKPA